MGTDWNHLAESAKSRSHIYELLAGVFREEPSEDFIKELRGPRLSEVFSDLEVTLGESFYNLTEAEVVEELSIEFTRLFIGPQGHISAHESIFTEADGSSRSLWGSNTVAVKSFIETTGLDYNPSYKGIPDHISVELEFMQQLALWEADKWDIQDRASAEYGLSIQRMFLTEHLLCWASEFCDQVIRQAEMPFYRVMAELTQGFLSVEEQSVSIETAA